MKFFFEKMADKLYEVGNTYADKDCDPYILSHCIL